jgi:hypothetical protein
MKNLTQTPSQLYNISQLDQYIISQGADQSDLNTLFGDLTDYDNGFYNSLEVDKILLEDQGLEFVRLVQSNVVNYYTPNC